MYRPAEVRATVTVRCSDPDAIPPSLPDRVDRRLTPLRRGLTPADAQPVAPGREHTGVAGDIDPARGRVTVPQQQAERGRGPADLAVPSGCGGLHQPP